MNRQVIKEKFFATAIHFLVTCFFVAIAWILIFLVWFPHPFEEMMGGTKLFFLVLCCDLVLGPLLSFIIFNSQKSHFHLFADYTIIAILQLAALIYGIFVVSESRPVFVVFVKDHFEVVSAIELDSSDLKEAKSPDFAHLSWVGPKYAAVQMPTDIVEKNEALFLALAGKDLSLRPKYYCDYNTQTNLIREKSQRLDGLLSRKPDALPVVQKTIRDLGLSFDSLKWLPVKHRFGFWIVLIDRKTMQPKIYLPIDPY